MRPASIPFPYASPSISVNSKSLLFAEQHVVFALVPEHLRLPVLEGGKPRGLLPLSSVCCTLRMCSGSPELLQCITLSPFLMSLVVCVCVRMLGARAYEHTGVCVCACTHTHLPAILRPTVGIGQVSGIQGLGGCWYPWMLLCAPHSLAQAEKPLTLQMDPEVILAKEKAGR